MRATVLAWILGWLLVTAAAEGLAHHLAPGVPRWIVPAASAGVLCLSVAGWAPLWHLARLGVRGAQQAGKERKA